MIPDRSDQTNCRWWPQFLAHRLWAASIVVLLALAGGPLCAEDPDAKSAETRDPEPEEVIQPLTTDDPLERVISQMRVAEERISQRDTGAETQSLQRNIVDDLDKLIEIAQQQSRQQRSSPNQQQQQQDDSSQQSKQEQSQQPQPSQQQGATSAQGVTQQQNDQAEQSTQRDDQADEIEIDLQTRNRLITEFWGHLPPAIRQRLLNIREEKDLPKYSDLVRQYFEALAEQGTRKDRQ